MFNMSLTFLATTFLYPFGISNVVMAGFTVKERPVEEKTIITEIMLKQSSCRHLIMVCNK